MLYSRQRFATRLRTAWGAVWRIVLFYLVFGILGALIFVPLGSKLEAASSISPVRGQFLADALGAVVMLAATWAMVRFIDRRPFQTVGFERGHIARDAAAGMTLGTAWLAASVGVVWAAGWATLQSSAGVAGPMLLLSGLSVLLNVLTQQLLLCGYILQVLRRRFGFRVALVVSAALFMAYHAAAYDGALLPAANVFVAGALFCLAYGATGNLWLPTALHFTWNFLLGPVLGLTVSGSDALTAGWRVFILDGPELFTGGAFGLEGGLFVTVTTTLSIVTVAAVARGAHFRTRGSAYSLAG
jgi:uncharacterized protein